MTSSAVSSIPLRQDARTIGLVGLAHSASHFSHLMLPPLFPWFIQDFGLNYSQLGLLVSVFFVISAIGQALSGFVVDRIGARPVLFASMACFVASACTAALATGYGGLALSVMLAGLGNSTFHPVDFTILNKRVSQPRLGHAFSAHGISGNLGWAAAPVFLAGIATLTGQWRMAYVGAALLMLGILLLLWWHRDAIDDRQGSWGPPRTAPGGGAPATAVPAAVVREHPMAFLRLPSVWLCFLFFFWTTCSLSAIQSFASPALQQIYGLPLATTALVVTGYMLFSASGMVIGGFLVPRVPRLEAVIAVCMLTAAVLLALAGSAWLPGLLGAFLVAFSGMAIGLAGPSRDMLIKRAAPPGATGRVYGTVYSGLDVGFALAAPVFGYLLDHGEPSVVFYGSSLALICGVLSAGLVGMHVARKAPVVRPA